MRRGLLQPRQELVHGQGQKKFRRPEKSYAAILSRHVTERIHRYTPVEPVVPAAKTEALPPSAFETSASECSIPLAGLASTSQTPSWYTAGPEQVSRIHADLELFVEASATGQFREVAEQSFLGELCDWSHQMAITRRGDPGDGGWMFALHHWSESAVLVWPAIRRQLPQNEGFALDIDLTVREAKLVAFYDLGAWLACRFKFRSPSWQLVHTPRSAASLPPSVRFIETLLPRLVVEILARCGWLSLGKTFLGKLAHHLDCEVPTGSSLYETLEALTVFSLRSKREEALAHVRHRLAADEQMCTFCEELIELEEVSDVQTKQDERAFKDTQKAAKVQLSGAKALRGEYTMAAASVAKEKAAAVPGAKRRKTATAERTAPLCSDVSQSDAASLCPPGASIWGERVDGAWCSHFPPFPRVSRAWRKHGEAESLRLILVDLWSKHCMISGILLPDCPLKGVLDSIPLDRSAQTKASGSQSSSSRRRS